MSYQKPYESRNPYSEEFEIKSYNEHVTGSSTGVGDFVQFMNSVGEVNKHLDEYFQLINSIDAAHKRLLTEVNEEQEIDLRRQLDSYAARTSDFQCQLKEEMKYLHQQAVGDSSKIAQAENTKQRFLKLIQEYRVTEANYKEENKQQAMRQYRIIQPEATEQEVEAAITDVGSQHIFSQALLNANRRGEAKTALAEVQVRHQEFLKLEKTMAELTQLFNDMEHLVIEQNEQVEEIDKQVAVAQQDVEQGVGHTNKAVKSAKRARKNKIRCLLILVLVLIILAIAITIPLVKK